MGDQGDNGVGEKEDKVNTMAYSPLASVCHIKLPLNTQATQGC